MFKQCTDAKTAARQKEIALGTISILSKNTGKRYSTAQLCEKLKVPRRTFYHYFETQEDIFAYCIKYLQDEYIPYDLALPKVRSSEEALDVNYRFWYQHRDMIRVLVAYGQFYNLVNAISDNLAENGFGDFASHYEKGSKTYTVSIRLLVFSVMSIFLDWMNEGFRTPRSAVARSAVQLITHPLVKV